MPFYTIIFCFKSWIRLICQIYEHGPWLTIKGQCIFIISFAQDLLGLEARHLLDGTVPGYDPALFIDNKGGIGQKVYDIR